MRTKLFGALSIGAVVVFAGVTAFAGSKSSFPLQVNLSTRNAWGDISATRNSPDTKAYFWCQVNANTSGAYLVSCSGADTLGTAFSCTSSNANIIAAARSIEGDGYVDLFWDASGVCTALSVRKGSIIAPKAP
jgi:hypothetical protein